MTVLTPANAFPNLSFPQHGGGNIARKFNGSSDAITLSGLPALTSQISISYWYNQTALPGASYPNRFSTIIRSSSTAHINYVLEHVGSSPEQLTFTYTTAGSTYVSFTVNLTTQDTGVWHNIIITTDFTSANTKIYQDGVSLSVSTSGSPGTPENATGKDFIGVLDGSGDYFNGSLFDIAIWSTLLSSGNVASINVPARAGTLASASLVGYWPFTGASPEPDITGSGNNGTLTGTTIVSGPSSFGSYLSKTVTSYTYPGAVWPKATGPAVLSYTNAFPNLAFPQHLSGQTTTVQNFLYPGAVQPQFIAAPTVFPDFYGELSNLLRVPRYVTY